MTLATGRSRRHAAPPCAGPSAATATASGCRRARACVFSSGQLGIAVDDAVPDGRRGAGRALLRRTSRRSSPRPAWTSPTSSASTPSSPAREHMPAYMAVRDRCVGDPPPASTLVIVGGFTRPEFKVEVEATAARAAADAPQPGATPRGHPGMRLWIKDPIAILAEGAERRPRRRGRPDRRAGRRGAEPAAPVDDQIFDASPPRRPPGPRQHPPPLLPDADARPSGGDQQGAVPLAAGALSRSGRRT